MFLAVGSQLSEKRRHQLTVYPRFHVSVQTVYKLLISFDLCVIWVMHFKLSGEHLNGTYATVSFPNPNYA
jgi:hypothetical protein